jgi:uncharacterized SAM-binding protein YcdF (DUF218 family)
MATKATKTGDRRPVPCYIIFGAAVKSGGQPSGTLLRRLQGAWQVGKNDPESRFIVTGGQGRFGPPEAHVMKSLLLGMGAKEEQVLLEDQAVNTLQSVLFCKEILLQQHGQPHEVTVCSSRYHNYRCQLLFRLVGVRSRRGDMPSDRAALGNMKWMYYYLREAVAIPWAMIRLGYKQFTGSEPTKT